jgi:mono/diheme cytochrome c family protein
MAGTIRGLRLAVVWVGVGGLLTAAAASDRDGQGVQTGRKAGPFRQTAQKKVRKKGAPKGGLSRPAPDETAPGATAGAAAPAAGALKFSRDVAPILVANCIGCHNPRQRRGKFDLTTFDKLMEGTPDEKVIAPGKPEESHLVLRIKGLEKPKMPQGGNRNLSDEAIARIERWVKEGAVLDAGVDRTALLEKIAASPEELRKAELARKTPEERDKLVESVGLERWKKANPKAKPEVTSGTHFLLFGTLPKERAGTALKAVEGQLGQVRALVGPSPVDWGEKGSLYVFNDAGSYIEFVRSLENREVEVGDTGTARFSVPEPYVAVIDPFGGRAEPPGSSSPRRPARGRRSDESADAQGGERSLAGLLSEQLVIGTLERAGKPPRWLTLGLGAKLASRGDPRPGYYQKLRRRAAELYTQGWVSKANDALGGATKTEDIRAVGFAIVEWLATVDRSVAPAFVQGMLAGGEKLDDVLTEVMSSNRAQLLAVTGAFVVENYGRGR